MSKKYIFLGLIPLIFVGCTSSEPKISFTIPDHVEQMPDKSGENVNNTGSLFGKGDSPLFSDRKAMKVNDLVTVVITESVQSSSEAEKKLEKDSSTDLGGGVFSAPANLPGTNTGISAGLNKMKDKMNALTNVGFETASTNQFNGKGSNSRSESFSTKITARVLKVMTNDTYYIEGARELLIDGEKQLIRIGGIVRADDITRDNTVDSQFLADAKVLYYTEGDIKNSSKKGWISKTVENMWPF